MEDLVQIFPDVPTNILQRVFHSCEGNVEEASDWLCENDWRDVDREEEEGDADADVNDDQNVSNGEATTNILAHAPTSIRNGPIISNETTDIHHNSDEDEEDDEEDEEEDEDDDNMYYDSGDEGDGDFTERRIPPLVNRVKILHTDTHSKEQRFWVAFDDDIMQKSMIELLNISLSKLAHHRVALLNTTIADKETAEAQLQSMTSSNTPESPFKGHAKRKHSKIEDSTAPGYFAHFFPVNDLDILWRSVLHGHLLNHRFGDLLEFRSASCPAIKRRDFDELMNVHTHLSSLPSMHRQQLAATGLSTELKCVLLLPCESNETEITRVGKNIHGLMGIPGGLYFRSHSTIISLEKQLSEETFRACATHRMRKEESTPDLNGSGYVMGYQPPKKVAFVLQQLDDSHQDETNGDT